MPLYQKKNLLIDLSLDLSSRHWIIVELTSIGEKETNLDNFRKSVYKLLGRKDLEVFIPAVSHKVRDEQQTFVYMEGYIFVEYNPEVPYLKLKDTTFFKDVLCEKRGRKIKYSVLKDSELDSTREGLKKFKVHRFEEGQRVRVVKGNYKNLKGTVTELYDDIIQIIVQLRSKKLLVEFPPTYLEAVKDE